MNTPAAQPPESPLEHAVRSYPGHVLVHHFDDNSEVIDLNGYRKGRIRFNWDGMKTTLELDYKSIVCNQEQIELDPDTVYLLYTFLGEILAGSRRVITLDLGK